MAVDAPARRTSLSPSTVHFYVRVVTQMLVWTSLRMLQRIYDQASPTDDFDAMAGRLRTEDDLTTLPHVR